MKKLNFLKMTLLAIVMMVGSVGVMGQTTVTHTFSGTSGTIDANITYTTEKNAANAPAYTSNQLRLYSHRDTGDGNTITFTPSNGAVITSVSLIKASDDQSPSSVTCSVDGQSTIEIKDTYSISGISASQSVVIKNAHMGGTKNLQMRLTGVTITYVEDLSASSIVVAPESLDFASVNIGSASLPQTITVTGANLETAPTYSVDNTEFEVSVLDAENLTVDGGLLSVTFIPTSLGAKTATLTLTSGETTASVALTGIATDPNNPYNLDDTNPVNSLNETFEGGSIPATWTNVAVQGDKTWEVLNYDGSNYYAQMSAYGGTGVYQTLLISPAINFEAISKNNVTFDWKAGFAKPGTFLKVYVMSKDGNKTEVKSIQATEPANGYATSFTKETLDLSAFSGVKFLVFEYNGDASGATTTYQVDNVVALPNTPTIIVAPSELSFTAFYTETVQKTLTVTGSNLTEAPSFEITGADSSDFSAEGTLTTEGGTLTITFAPISTGDKTATLTITSGTASASVSLTGLAKEQLVLIGEGTLENPYTVADVKVLNNSTGTTKHWVKGYIIGVPSGGNGTDLTTVDLDAPFASNTAIALSDLAFETDLSKMIGVQLPSGAIRTALNLQDNEVLLNVPVLVYGTLEGYFSGTPGVKNTSDYRILKSISKQDGYWSDEATWLGGTIPNSTLDVLIKNEVTIADLANANKVTIQPNGKLTIVPEVVLEAPVQLLSDATGTATLIGHVDGQAEVQQYLASQRNWYMSSPVANATRPGTESDIVEYYNEPLSKWEALTSGTLTAGKGYVVYPTGEKTISFTGELDNGYPSINLTREGTTKAGFNLVGNPYPAYYNANNLLHSNTDILPTIWYRTNDGSSYIFQTYNAESAIGVPANADYGYIPPMQAFWVRVKEGQTAGTLSFDRDDRSHKPIGALSFRAPQAPVNQILRLQLSNGTATDEAVVYFNENAENAFDNYDSPKMMNNGTSVPNIYTKADAENLVINGMNAVPYGQAIPLFVNGKEGNYTLSATEFSNFASSDKVMLMDSKTASEVNLNNGDYSFTIETGENTNNRFTLVFPKADAPTALDQVSKEVSVSVVGNKILVVADNADMGSDIHVFNSVGQRILSQKVDGIQNEINGKLQSGVYFVKLNNRTAKVLVK